MNRRRFSNALGILGLSASLLTMACTASLPANEEAALAESGIELVAMDAQVLQLRIAAGLVEVDRQLFRASDDLVATLQHFAELAETADFTSEQTLTLKDDILLGRHLRSEQALITDHGVLRLVDHSQVAAAQQAAISTHAKALIAALPETSIGRHARAALSDLIGKLDQPDSSPVTDEINPAFARKVVADGWLLRTLDEVPQEAAALTEAVQAATNLQAQTHYTGNGDLRYAEYGDSWETRSLIYSWDDGVRYATTPPLPMYHWPLQGSDGFQQAQVVVELPAGSNPRDNPQLLRKPLSAKLYHRDQLLASWDPSAGLEADESIWRQVVPATHRRLDDQIVDNYMPPHIVLRDGSHHIHGIITAQGILYPATDGSREQAERFMDDAARLLPDAAHLDLISQYLFKYVYDSPDPTMPLLMGNRDHKSDIHQTAYETMSTTVGGVCRGDCDDLSELIEHIVDRQGRVGHVISLPGHAALAWAEEFDDQWHVFVMQTGPTLQFSDERLQDALRAAYQSFDASDTFDPNAIGLLLRFSGENRRSAWRLSYRIFSDPEYSATMIDVQKDWHYQTYLQAINKMLELIAEGDEDTANFRELAGLYSFTGQYEEAVKYHQWAMERTEEDESRLLMGIEMLMHLHDAGHYEDLGLLARDMLDQQIPALHAELGQSVIQVGLQLAGSLARYDHPELAARALRDTLGSNLGPIARNVAQWSQRRFNPEAWMHSSELRMISRILGWHSRILATILEEDRDGAITEAVPELAHFQQVDETYRQHIAFNDQGDGGDLAATYALQGRHLAARLGRDELLSALAQSELPSAPINHRDREVADDELRQRDLSWIKASITYWSDVLLDSIDPLREPLSDEQLAAIQPQLLAALEVADELKMSGPRTDYQAHFGKLLLALLTEDEAALKDALHYVKKQDDKQLIDSTAQYMGDSAHLLEREWFSTTVKLWRDIVDHKPKYLWIAWRAALADAPEHALIAAAISAERFPEDQAFVDEYQFMQQLFAKQQTQKGQQAKPAEE